VRLLLLGPPGAGKGTQGKRLAAALGVPHIAAGGIVRHEIARGSAFGRKIEAAIAQGRFAPDEDMIALLRERLAQPDTAQGCILDGFPRDLVQAQAFDGASGAHKLDAVLDFVLEQSALRERLAGRWMCPVCTQVYHLRFAPPAQAGRCDTDGANLVRRPEDDAGAVQERLHIYERVTLPLRAYYTAQGVLHSLDARGSIDAVQGRILECLGAQGLLGADNALAAPFGGRRSSVATPL